MTNAYCPIIHSGLVIDLKWSDEPYVTNCCLRLDRVPAQGNIWQSVKLVRDRTKNLAGQWDPSCWSCQGNEQAGLESYRTGSIMSYGTETNLPGPKRLDLMFDISCNLACRTCGPHSSSLWQKHLKSNNIAFKSINDTAKTDEMIAMLKTLDLSRLETVVFGGGETLLGQGYWTVAELLLDLVPNAKQQLTVCFQTNGTQTISARNLETVSKFKAVKLNVSLDGVGERFEYLRWPATWLQVTDNLAQLLDSCPDNVEFLIEETLSIFNLYYTNELKSWAADNFSVSKWQYPIHVSSHPANKIFALAHVTQEYVDALTAEHKLLLPRDWQEDSAKIQEMIATIDQFDQIRQQDWQQTFPEVADFYRRYIK